MDGQQSIRVMVVDDHAVVRSGLVALLQSYGDLELVGQAADGSEALRLCTQVEPDVILMDIVMPVMDGVAATRGLRRTYPHAKVVMLTSCREPEMVTAAIRAGAKGYLVKNATPEEVVAAVREVHIGRPALSQEATEALITSVSGPSAPAVVLTERERDVLALLVAGMSNAEIAQRLVVSRSTVKFHLGSIFNKLGVNSRTEAVALAMQQHLVS